MNSDKNDTRGSCTALPQPFEGAVNEQAGTVGPNASGEPAWVKLTFASARRGDCELRNGVLQLWEDGRARWSCETWTNHTHSGDEWLCWFGFRDARGFLIRESDAPNAREIITPNFKSPRMSDGGPHYPWQVDFSFPVAWFQRLFSVMKSGTMWASC